MIKIKLVNDFDLESTISCGQIFRFEKQNDNSYNAILSDRVVNIKQSGNYLYVSSNDENDLENVITNYLDLKTDYKTINDKIKKMDKNIVSAVEFSKGLTMIKQDPFEASMAYIISANNGVPQITAALNNIATAYGKKIMFNNKDFYLFPKPIDLKGVSTDEYRNCKVGFRDKYLKEFVDKINNNKLDLNKYYDMNTSDALDDLQKNNGIGPKVASCILLFAYQKYDVFPVDTWVKKVMKQTYGIEGEANIRKFAKETYGKYSGLAIQYMFNYGRNKRS